MNSRNEMSSFMTQKFLQREIMPMKRPLKGVRLGEQADDVTLSPDQAEIAKQQAAQKSEAESQSNEALR